MDPKLSALLDELFRFGDDNDARETERPRRMLNITPDTGRLLSILIRSSRHPPGKPIRPFVVVGANTHIPLASLA